MLLGMLAGALLLLLFAWLAASVLGGGTAGFDRRVLLLLRNPADPADPLGPRWVEEMVRDVTALGGTAVLLAVTFAASGYLAITGRWPAALLLAGSVLGGMALGHALKWGFARPRPDLVPHGAATYTASFPSSHAMMSALVYLTVGALLARNQRRRRVKLYLIALSGLLAVLIGASRVYLGVHWPTDVLAGWAIGAGWAVLSWLAMLRLQRRREAEAGLRRPASSRMGRGDATEGPG